MQTTIINLAAQFDVEHGPERKLTFAPFVRFMKKRSQEPDCIKGHFFNYVVEQFEKHPQFLEEIDLTEVQKHAELLQLIYSTLTPLIEDEEVHRWALSLPLTPTIFYSTNAFSKLVTNIATGEIRKTVSEKHPAEMKKNQLEFSYSIILEKCYNIPSFFPRETVHSLTEEGTGLVKYYKMKLDTRFIDIHPLRPLPQLTIASLQSQTHDNKELLSYLEEILPLDMFRFEGFGITGIADVTPEQSIENIKNIILNGSSLGEEKYYADVIQSLKTLVGNADINFGLLPVLQVNDKLIFNDATCLNSRLIKVAGEQGVAEMAYMSLADSYLKNPKLMFFPEITAEDEARRPYLKMLTAQGISSYALAPVFFNNSLAGVLEIYSTQKNTLGETIISKLEPAIPLLAQLLKNNIDAFDGSIDTVIKEKFTSIQPAVQWKFNEVAWHYLRDQKVKPGYAQLQQISFENVYPLYGAVDVRNSTIERNKAMQKDLHEQFTVLIDVLGRLKAASGFGLIDEKIFQCQHWLNDIADPAIFNHESKLNDYLELDINPFLVQFAESQPEYNEVIQDYFNAVDEKTGSANENRRLLEQSMNTVISSVNNYFEKMNGEIQQAYPCYFEKFRTDGVEYDIYLGQSITPDKPYKEMYLNNLRLLQLTSLAEVAKKAHALVPQLAKPVETTQLIFIYSHSIDIRFRRDEKRFDVEGAYNIRYHIIKKRIDKVNIRDTKERLTQPGKIAMVYFNQKDADEYISYIKYLQEKKILQDDLEYLELEELQGVSGLKALRVGIVME